MQRRLHLETLEARLVLSASSPYSLVSSGWFAAAPAGGTALASGATASGSASETHEWIVRLSAAATETAGSVAGAAQLLNNLPIVVQQGLGLPGQLLVSSTQNAVSVATALTTSSLIASFEQNLQIGATDEPNDPLFASRDQYDLFNNGLNGGTVGADIDAVRAWDLTHGSTRVVTAVIDSGIYYAHPDLYQNIWINQGEIPATLKSQLTDTDADGLFTFRDLNSPANASFVSDRPDDDNTFIDAGDLLVDVRWSNGLDDDHNGPEVPPPNTILTGDTFIDDLFGWDFRNHDNNPLDDHGHGTHVAGTIGAVSNNALGIAGVNWATSLMPLKFLDTNNVGTVADAARAINYATLMRVTQHVNVPIINASWGGVGADSATLRDVIAASGAADMLFVSAAGNGDVFGRGQNIDTLPFYPASFNLDNMLVVAATDHNDQLAPFSNYGTTTVDIAAPGVGIWSTDLLIEHDPTTGVATSLTPNYATRSGTSMAAPHVAGAAALAWASKPGATAAEIKAALLAGADNAVTKPLLQNLQGKVFGGKRLNAYGALLNIPPQATVQSAPAVTTIGGTSYPFTVQITSNLGISLANADTTPNIGSGDFVVRRQGASGNDLATTLVGTPTNSNGGRQWTATYQLTPPGGSWDVLDAGTYDIVFVGDQIVDGNGRPNVQKTIGSFSVDLSSVGVFRPDVFTDGADANPGDGLAKTAGNKTTLRAALQEANLITPAINPNGGTVILAPGTYQLTLGGAGEDATLTGDLDITGHVTIASDGTGPVIIQANGIDRVFDVLAGGNLTLQGVTIRGGYAVGEDGGGIRNYGTLLLNATQIEDSAAESSFQALVPVGGETLVNTTLTGPQVAPDVTTNAAGNVIVAWRDTSVAGGRIAAQQYDRFGSRIGTEIILSQGIVGTAIDPAIARMTSGTGVVLWQDSSFDGNGWGINGRVLSAAGVPTGSSVTPNTSAAGDQAHPEIATNGTNRYIAAWTDGNGRDGDQSGVFAALYDASGVRIPGQGGEFRVNTIIAGVQNGAAVGMWSDGSSVIAFHGAGTNVDVHARLFDANGTPLPGPNGSGVEFLVTNGTANHQVNPKVSVSANGFVVVWEDSGYVMARRFNRSGVALGDEFRVTTTQVNPLYQDVTTLPDGGFFAVWDTNEGGGDAADIWGQQFAVDGSRIGTPLRINSTTAGYENDPDVTADATGNVTVVWNGQGAGDSDGVFAQRFELVTQNAGGNGAGIYNAGTLIADGAVITRGTADGSGGGLFNAPAATATITTSTIAESSALGDAGPTLAQAFGNGGKLVTSVGSAADTGRDVVVQPDGKIVVAGYATNGVENDFVVMRYLPSGLLDASFGIGGIVVTDFGGDDVAVSMALDSEGRIVVGGSTSVSSDLNFALARYLPNGALDTDFDGDGRVVTSFGAAIEYIADIAIQSDGKIIAAGSRNNGANYDFAVARYTVSGVLDGSFDSDGLVNFDFGGYDDQALDVVVQSDGKIVLGGYSNGLFAAVRLLAGGGFDLSFDGDGKTTVDFLGGYQIARAVALRPDGRIVLAGWEFNGINGSTNDFAIAQLTSTGSLDTTFDGDGKQITDFGQSTEDVGSVVVLPNGKIVVVGYATFSGNRDFAIARYSVDGSLDETFEQGGLFTAHFGSGSETAWGATVGPSGQVYVIGQSASDASSDIALLELSSDVSAGGGGIYNAGMFTISQTTIDGNNASDGGGVYNETGATFTVSSSTISNNDAMGAQSPLEYVPSGSEFRVNSTTTNIQYEPEVVGNGLGKVFVAYRGLQTGAYEDYGVFVQESGPTSAEFYISSSGDNVSTQSIDAAMNTAGRVVTAFGAVSNVSTGETTIYTRRYDAATDISGSSASGYAAANTSQFLPEYHADARIAINDSDNGVAVWNYNDGSTRWPMFRRFGPGGAFTGSPIKLGTATASAEYTFPDVAIDAQGRFVIVWTGRPAGQDSGIYLQLFDANGNTLVAQQKISLSAGDVSDVRVERDGNGFTVVWQRGSGASADVVARRFDSAGTAVTSEILLSESATGQQTVPHLTLLPDGGFFAVWQSQSAIGDDGAEIRGQKFSATNVRIGPEFVVNFTTAGDQTMPTVARLGADTLVVTWAGSGSGDSQGVFARVLEAGHFVPGGDGGGIFNAGTITSMTNVTVSGNSAGTLGGGILNATRGTSTIASTTVVDNAAGGSAGGIEFLDSPPSANVGNQPINVAAGDLNGDGRLDLVTSNYSSNDISILIGNGDGSFQSEQRVAVSNQPAGLVLADFNHDNKLDLAAAGESGNNISVRLGTGIGTFGPDTPVLAGGYLILHAGDINGDGHVDLVAGQSYGTSGQILTWLGDGTGHFGPINHFNAGANAAVNDFVLTDIDADGDLDVAVAYRYGTTIDLLKNSGGNFTYHATLANTWTPGKLAVGDVNHDGRPDLLSDNAVDNSIHLFLSTGLATYAAPNLLVTGLQKGGRLAIADLDGDGNQDLIASNWEDSGNPNGDLSILAGHGDGTFEPHIRVGAANNIDGLTTADVNGDGSPDIISASRETTGSIHILLSIAKYGDGIVSQLGGTVSLQNTIVANNSSQDSAADVMGHFQSLGGNLISRPGNAVGLVNGVASNKIGTRDAPLDAKLGALADNAGPTKTHLPAVDSPAIDAGVSGPAEDQIGNARPQDGNNNGTAAIDIGAVERYYASISGRKFQDDDGDGLQDVGELGLAGWTIFLDTNNNGVLDAGERSTTTAANGDYSFPQLPPGTYNVAEVNQLGWTRTYTSTNFASHVRNNQPDSLGANVTGLSIVHELALSPDGKHAYAINSSNSLPDSIVAFRRNATTGALEFVAALTDGSPDSLGTAVSGLEGEGHVVVSPDGNYVYALGTSDNAVVVFARNSTTGVLTFKQKVVDGDEIEGELVEGMLDPRDLVISPDGKQVYIISGTGSAVVSFSRSLSTGLLTVLPVWLGGGPATAISGDGKHVYATSGNGITTYSRSSTTGVLTFGSTFLQGQLAPGGGTADALQDVADMILSPDGKNLYTLSRTDQSVGVYSRNTATGDLKYETKLTRGVPDSAGKIVDGLQGGKSLAISPNGDRLYATADGDDSVAIFSRNTSTGTLVYLHVLKEFGTDSTGLLMETLNNSDGVAVSPDGLSIYVAAREGTITRLSRDGLGLDRKTLVVGQELSGVNFSASAARGEIHGTVYNDLNNNGFRDDGESVLAGITVYLDNDLSNTITAGDDTVTTDVFGQYSFTNLIAPKPYSVRVVLSPGQTVTSPAVGGEWNLTLQPGQIVTSANFDIYSLLTGIANNQILGVVWQDTNQDGVQQGGEPPLAGRQVYLDANDNGVFDAGDIAAAQLTSASGGYSFTGLGVANFAVRVVTNPGELTKPVGNLFAKQTYTTGDNPVGVIAADLNNDGRSDLISVDKGSNKVSLRKQLANGTFDTRIPLDVATLSSGIAVGYFNNDNLLDIAVVRDTPSNNKIEFLINNSTINGNLSFTKSGYTYNLAPGNTSIVAADFVSGGRTDLAIILDGTTDHLLVLQGTSTTATPSFTELQDITLSGNPGPLALAAGLLNNDSFPDIVVANYVADNVMTFTNNGGGNFTLYDTQSVGLNAGPSSVTIVPDLTGDGKHDVVVTNTVSSAVLVLPGDNLGGLDTNTPIPVTGGPRSVAVADLDSDGDLDLVVGNSVADNVVILRNQGNNTFSFAESSGLASFASLVTGGVKQVLVTQLNTGDTVPDLVAVRGTAETGSLSVLLGQLSAGSQRVEFTGSGSTVDNKNFGVYSTTALPGDYDHNGSVSASDYQYWRTNFAATNGNGLQADGNANGVVDAADYVLWRNALGSGTGAIANAAALPPSEPAVAATVVTLADEALATPIAAATSDSLEPPVVDEALGDFFFAGNNSFATLSRPTVGSSTISSTAVANATNQQDELLLLRVASPVSDSAMEDAQKIAERADAFDAWEVDDQYTFDEELAVTLGPQL